MSAKVILVVCAQALFVQLALSQCAGRSNLGAGLSYGLSAAPAPAIGISGCAGPALPATVLPAPACSAPGHGYNGYGYGSNLGIEVIPTSGGSLQVTSTSALAPTGLTVASENIFEGSLYVVGELPFLSAVTLEGVVASGGAGGVSYSLGNGVTAIESIAPAGIAPAAAVAPFAASIAPVAAVAPIAASFAPAAALNAEIAAFGAGIAPLSIAPGYGCNAGYAPAPVAEIVAPSCGCGYQSGIYY